MVIALYMLLANGPKPYAVRAVTDSPASVRKALGGEESAIQLAGDVLSVYHRQAAGYVAITGGVQESMRPVPGTDLWSLHLRMRGWDRAVIQYAFFTPERPSPPYEAYRVWRGPRAPELRRATPLRGKLRHVNFSSAALGELRRVSVYLPPNAAKGIPVIYLADGETTEGFAQVIEPLIATGTIRPVALVGVYSGDWDTQAGRPKTAGGTRGAEYTGSGDRARRHRIFFTQEVRKWAAQTFGVSDRREQVAAAGFSNGGQFVGTLAGEYGTVFVMASGVPVAKRDALRTRFFFSVGELDPALAATKRSVLHVRALGGAATLDTFVGGHDFEIWRLGLVAMVGRAFPR